jgi:hypothetical protein
MWEARPLTTLYVSMACYRDSFFTVSLGVANVVVQLKFRNISIDVNLILLDVCSLGNNRPQLFTLCISMHMCRFLVLAMNFYISFNTCVYWTVGWHLMLRQDSDSTSRTRLQIDCLLNFLSCATRRRIGIAHAEGSDAGVSTAFGWRDQ